MARLDANTSIYRILTSKAMRPNDNDQYPDRFAFILELERDRDTGLSIMWGCSDPPTCREMREVGIRCPIAVVKLTAGDVESASEMLWVEEDTRPGKRMHGFIRGLPFYEAANRPLCKQIGDKLASHRIHAKYMDNSTFGLCISKLKLQREKSKAAAITD
ncbi:hypothetical protein IT575_00100 [bacterium]|nr:hypothetical protein [bacterium]